jgi:hypothetical protein
MPKTFMMESIESRLSSIENRLLVLESRIKRSKSSINTDLSEPIVKKDLFNRNIFSYRFVRVPSDYYDQPLSYRANLLNCETHQLCKSIVFENTACDHDRIDDITNSKYYLVIIQYEG